VSAERLPRLGREDLRMRAIHEVLRAMTEALPLDEILAVITNMAIIVFDATTSWIMLVDDGRVRTRIARGDVADALAGRECEIESCPTCQAALGTQPSVLQPSQIDPTDRLLGVFAGMTKTVVLVPIRTRDRSVGLFGCAVAPATPVDLPFLTTMAGQAAAAIVGALLREESRAWRQRLGAAFQQLVEAVLVFDRNGTLVLMNTVAADLFDPLGVRLGDSIPEVVRKTGLRGADGHPLSSEEFSAARALRGERVENFNVNLQTADGKRRYIQASATPVSEEGNITGAVTVWRDITPLKEAEEARARLLERVEAAEARYRGLFEGIPDAVVVTNVEARLVDVNTATATLLGYCRDELVGMRVADLVAAPEEWTAEEHQRVLRMGSWHGEVALRRKDGTTVPVESDAVRVDLPTGVVCVSVMRDITQRRRAEEERARLLHQVESERAWLRAVIDRSPVGIILIEGAHGKRVNANLQAERLFGRPLPPEGGLAQYVGQIYHPDGTPLERSEMATERALHGETVTIEEELIRQPSGQEVRLRASAVPIYLEGNIAGAVVIYEDVSRIRELERLREEWTSIIAHDLRQPVTIITGYASLLARQARRAARPEEEARAIGHVLTSAHNLSKMIGDLLDVSRIETHRLTIERTPTDLPNLIRAVVERSREITDGHPVRVEIIGEIPRLEIDPARVEQILTNLLSNAAKYSYPNSEIVVTAERRGEEVEVSVTNSGPGISPAELPRIFTRFYRARAARAGPAAGLGLGLYISKGLVEAHGGRIWCESTLGQTTTFHFTLPLRV
jgi:PAS domain S-box-containing protein